MIYTSWHFIDIIIRVLNSSSLKRTTFYEGYQSHFEISNFKNRTYSCPDLHSNEISKMPMMILTILTRHKRLLTVYDTIEEVTWWLREQIAQLSSSESLRKFPFSKVFKITSSKIPDACNSKKNWKRSFNTLIELQL